MLIPCFGQLLTVCCSAPEPKQKKNRELKTEILPLVNMRNPEG